MTARRRLNQVLDQLDAARVRFQKASDALARRQSAKARREFLAADEALDDAAEAVRKFICEVKNRHIH